MPEIMHFTVTETTTVHVSANTVAEALEKAEIAFINPSPGMYRDIPRRLETNIPRDS